ncbi:ABC transporter substrate-binding protein [Brevibacillus thermoruber]|jgi:iron complex transport system substrate-binding protein|uniref:ABC transporter substrate-binding protein n=1 Tax=Brevibacillus thermoruber TaxID=33942 RepID=A0A9X3TQT7_9BACL|nr:ABC transporter substrate-binding protein [Brevibacillus thermoruber]MDA5108780.1 ABC transporter substrate-binding protein [Brevibacillus thermoruber]
MKRSLWLVMGALVMALLGGCGGSGQTAGGPDQAPTPAAAGTEQKSGQTTSPGAKQTSYPLTVKDATGTAHTFAKAPERIVSTSPAETEILFALGLGDRVVAVSDYDDYPEEAKAKPKVGGVVNPNEEAIIAQRPDLVITGISMQDQVAEKLRSLGLVVWKTNPRTTADIMNNILLIGQITNRQEQAEAVVARMKEDIQRVKNAVQDVKPNERKKVYVEFAPGWTVGKGEFMDELITLAGGVNIAADMEGWNPISEEKVLKEDPDVILYASGVTDEKSGQTLEQIIRKRSGWDKMKAVRDQRVVGVDQNLLSRPGPRITQGLYEVAKAIYPDRVK